MSQISDMSTSINLRMSQLGDILVNVPITGQMDIG